MAAIALTADRISLLFVDQAEVYNLFAAVAITKGQAVYINSSGKAALSNSGSAGTTKFAGIALENAAANQALSVLKRGHVGGFTLSQAYGALAYLNDTNGVIGDAAGTNSKVVGVVVPLTDNPATPAKALYIDADQWRVG